MTSMRIIWGPVFILNLFCNRKNQVITQHGLTDPYDVLIGIDQGKLFHPYCGAYIMTRYSVKYTRDHTSVTLFSIHGSPILIILLLTTHFVNISHPKLTWTILTGWPVVKNS